ncbi:response regulator transcription factor [Streptomyces sp. yr375]|uniref:LuxR C-terminal-related transcriptional regulator n=1 Tax=Streptomyces sp. yr375 TaxID=1761906 RepID=UPI0015A67494|nr:response regulator transcription factor [Streptomyces sp. yr375]
MLVGDDNLLRSGLKQSLLRDSEFEVVAESKTDQSVIASVARKAPKVVVLDVDDRDEGDALRLVGQLSAASPRIRPRILILANQQVIDRILLRAIKLGVSGILLRGVTQDELVYAVRQVSRGHSVLQPLLTSRLFAGVRSLGPFPREIRGDLRRVLAALSPRERDVLAGVVKGMSNQEIAQEFSLTVATVKCHVSSILTKLGARDRLQAALIALPHSLFQGED